MSEYTPPKIKELAFRFSSGGYEKPQFDNLTYNFGVRPSYTSTSDIQASIEVMKTYQDSTYTYTKECRTIVVGYSANGIQTLKLPCSYGGIRDIGSSIYGHPESKDLLAYIGGQILFVDLRSFIRSTKNQYTDLLHWYRVNYRDTSDLSGGLIKILQEREVESDLNSYLNTIQPIDLQSLLNVIEISNIEAAIEGIWWKGEASFSTYFYKTFFRQSKLLNSNIHGWQTFDLIGNINQVWQRDLQANVIALHAKNLQALLSVIDPINITAEIHGYDTKDLSTYVTSTQYGPNDLQAYVSLILSKNLDAYIHGYRGSKIAYNLPAYITGSYIHDLNAYIDTIKPKDLTAYITSAGYFKDLYADIAPRTINIKRVISIPLLEHKDLAAVLNYSCFFSAYKNISAYVYPLMKKDLRASIVGWFTNGTADSVVELSAYINYADYKVIDTIDISGSPHPTRHVTHNISGGKDKLHRVFDTYNVFGGSTVANLNSYINGILNSSDLGATIGIEHLYSYTSIPSWVNPKYREVFINLDRFEERWKRFVDLMFFTNNDKGFYYFYVSGAEKVYKVDRNRTWTIWVTGYEEVNDDIIDRKNVRQKIVFDLSKYANIDEAVRDVMDRVAEFRKVDLTASIVGLWPHYNDLNASLSVRVKHSWAYHLKSTIKPVNSGINNLASDIVGIV